MYGADVKTTKENGINSGLRGNMKKEIDYREDVELKYIKNNELHLGEEDLPITITFEGRRKYILKMTPNGLILNKKD